MPIVIIHEFKLDPTPTDNMEKCVYKRDFNEHELKFFKQALFGTSWNSVKSLKQPNEAYITFIEIFIEHFDKYLPIRKIKKT